MKKQKAGLLYGNTVNKYSFQLDLLKIVEDYMQEDISNKLLYEEQACATIIINNKDLLRQRLLYQVERCKQGFMISSETFKNQGISVLEQVYLSVLRMFLIVKQQKQQMKVKQYSLFPNITFMYKSLKLSSYKFDSSSLLKKLIHSEVQSQTSFKQQLQRGTYGFLVFNQTKLGVIKRNDTSSIKSKNIVGIWIHQKGIKKQSDFELNPNSYRLIWGLAAMYVTNNNITNKTNVLVNSEMKRKQFTNSFLLCVFSEVSTKPYIYQIQIIGDESKWVFMENQSHILMPNVPLNFNMGNQCQIQSALISESSKLDLNKFDLEREQQRQFVPNFKRYESDNIATERNHSQISLSKKDSSKSSNKFFSNDTFARSQADTQSLRQSQFNDKTSDKSQSQKDIIIRQLRTELEFYKERYLNLQRIWLTQTQLQQSYPPMFNQFGMMPSSTTITPNIQNPLQITHPVPQTFPPFLNYPIHPQQMPPYYPMPQQYSSQVTYHANIESDNKISQSTVVDNNKESMKSSNFSFIKKQSNVQINNYSPKQITQQIRQPNVKVSQTQQLVPQSLQLSKPQVQCYQPQLYQQHNQTKIKSLSHQVTQQQFALDITNNNQQFLQFSDKQMDLNLSNIPHQRSPKPCNTDNQSPQFLQSSSLTYSYSRHYPYPNSKYTISNQDSVDYEQNDYLKQIQRKYQSK